MVTVKKKIQRGQKENHQQKKREEEEETDRPPVTRATAATVTKKNNWIRFVKAGKLFFFLWSTISFFFLNFIFETKKKYNGLNPEFVALGDGLQSSDNPFCLFFFLRGSTGPPSTHFQLFVEEYCVFGRPTDGDRPYFFFWFIFILFLCFRFRNRNRKMRSKSRVFFCWRLFFLCVFLFFFFSPPSFMEILFFFRFYFAGLMVFDVRTIVSLKWIWYEK